ncbi:hypothetical protein C2E23DRAFT_731379 [Lenzites betulinus]|nr:hypothetical protein C2E23DRAFT_731379 [Lenzites betulinus]
MVFSEARIPECTYYAQGRCAKGENCRFAHIARISSKTATVPMAIPPKPSICEFYERGICRFGDGCKLGHPNPAATLPGVAPPSTLSPAAPAFIPSAPVTKSSIAHVSSPTYSSRTSNVGGGAFGPCKFFVQGRCNKGIACPFPHVADVHEPVHPTTNLPLQSRPEETGAAVVGDHGSTEPTTTTRTKLGCTVVYGAGAAVQSVTTAFESPCVLMHSLPPSMTPAALITIAERFGELKSAALIPRSPQDPHALPSARIEYLAPADASRAVQALAQDPALKHARTRASVRLDLRGAESGTATLRSTKVKISWFAPSLTAWAHYGAISIAKLEAARLDGTTFSGRAVRASFQTPSWNQRTSFSVELKGLPLDAQRAAVKRFCRADSVAMGERSFVVADAVKALRAVLARHGALEAFDFVPPSDHAGTKPRPKLVAFAQFADADAASRAAATLHGARQPFLRNGPVFVELIHSVKYMLPRAQFAALRADIDALRDALETCKLRYHETDEHGAPAERVCVRAYGPDAKALARLKKELEDILRGDVVRGDDGQIMWLEYSATAGGREFLDALAADAQVYIRCDDRTRTIHLFGTQHGRRNARTRILEKTQALAAEEHIIDLDDVLFRRMLHGGFRELQDSLSAGENLKMFFDVVRKRIVVEGDAANVRTARAAVAKVHTGEPAQRLSTDDAPCPVCFCDVSDPLALPCGHTYCRACLQHYLASLAHTTGGGGGSSTATCLASVPRVRDDGTTKESACGLGVPLPIIRTLLSPGQEERMLEAAFLAHIHSRAQEFKYCPTADCATVYRAGVADSVLRCPTCLARICAFCHVEAHEGLGCAEYKDQAAGGDASFQRWREAHDVRPCPGCGTGLEKSGGCNHMCCTRCRAHICWVCMKVFNDTDSGGGVYAHMRREHGGIGI